MKMLYDEIPRRFPEIRRYFFEGDEELSYLFIGYLVDWLEAVPEDASDPKVIDRLVSFAKWCEGQPRGKDASDDLYTILVVGFYEKLFESDITRPLIPKFLSRDELIAGADYLRTWVGVDNYDKALKYYDSDT